MRGRKQNTGLSYLRETCPASLSPVLKVFTIIFITNLVSRFGPAALAGYGIGARLEFLLIPLIFGIGAALTAMVEVNIGAGTVLWPVAEGVLRVVVAVGGASAAVKLGMGLSGIFTMTALGMAIFGVLTALSVLLGAWRDSTAASLGIKP